MDQIKDYSDSRNKAWCVHCCGWLSELKTNRDHVPSKGLLRKPYPTNVPVVEVCSDCNNGFSIDEEYLKALLSCILSGSTSPERQTDAEIAKLLRGSPKLAALIERGRTEYRTLGGETRCLWKPDYARARRIVLKNARGHALYELGEPMMDEPEYVQCYPLEALSLSEREEFENLDHGGLWPEVGSRMLTRVVEGQDISGPWIS